MKADETMIQRGRRGAIYRRARPDTLIAQVFWIEGEDKEQGAHARARRVVACWNACAGLAVEQIEAGQHVLPLSNDERIALVGLVAEWLDRLPPDTFAHTRAGAQSLFDRLMNLKK